MVASEDLEKFRVAGGNPGRGEGSDGISSSNGNLNLWIIYEIN
jgi:hypothetical protein